MGRVADRLIEALGLGEHQVLIVAHRDRDHPHVHLLVNRVHPETGTAWDRWQDRRAIQQVLREEERVMGLRTVDSSPAVREPGRPMPQRASEREPDEPRPEQAPRQPEEPPVGLLPPARPVQSRVDQLAADLRALARVERLASEHEAARSESAVARARLAEFDNAVKRAELAERMFREALASVYREPEAARRAFDALAAERGIDDAARAMRDTPERLGNLVAAERRRALGLLRAEDDGAARQAAGVAARLGASALAAERAAWATASDVAARRAEDAFATALRALYERPGEARGQFDRLVRHEGVERAAAVLRETPARFDALRPDLGADPALAAARAAEAATIGLEAARARATARADDIRAWQGTYAAVRVGAEMEAIRREVARTAEAEHGVQRALAASPSATRAPPSARRRSRGDRGARATAAWRCDRRPPSAGAGSRRAASVWSRGASG